MTKAINPVGNHVISQGALCPVLSRILGLNLKHRPQSRGVQIVFPEERVKTHQNGLKLSSIPRPGTRLKLIHYVLGQRGSFIASDLPPKESGERRNVFRMIAQPRASQQE